MTPGAAAAGVGGYASDGQRDDPGEHHALHSDASALGLAGFDKGRRHLQVRRSVDNPGSFSTSSCHKDLIPALGALPLEQLRHEHVAALIAELEKAGRGAPTIRYLIAVLSSALSDAVRRHRLTHNVARHKARTG